MAHKDADFVESKESKVHGELCTNHMKNKHGAKFEENRPLFCNLIF